MLLSCVIQINEGWWKEQHWLECIRSDYNGEPQHGAGAVVHHQMLGDHLQVHDVLSGARERLGEHQHGARIAGTLQENEPINENKKAELIDTCICPFLQKHSGTVIYMDP